MGFGIPFLFWRTDIDKYFKDLNVHENLKIALFLYTLRIEYMLS